MKKIGFIDYYLGEWHANNYPKWFIEASQKLGYDYKVAYAWAEKDVSPQNNVTTDQWCKEMGVVKCDSVKDVAEKSDIIVVLAPSDPEKHLEYAKEVFKYGKPVYIDKTFAPNFDEANEIFRLAKENGITFFSTSALRYAEELNDFKGAGELIITGGGSNFNEYIIHTAEIAVVLGKIAKRVKVEKIGNQRICTLEDETGERNAIIFSPAVNFSICGINAEGTNCQKDITSNFFFELMCQMLIFFETGKEPFDSQQTLQVMKLRDALLKAEENDGTFVLIQ